MLRILAFSLIALVSQDDKAYRIGGDVTKPSILRKVEPTYPKKSKNKTGGTVKLSLIIRADGHPSDLAVTKSLDKDLDQAAVDAVKQWVFKPATKDGEPVDVYATVDVRFHMGRP